MDINYIMKILLSYPGISLIVAGYIKLPGKIREFMKICNLISFISFKRLLPEKIFIWQFNKMSFFQVNRHTYDLLVSFQCSY